MKKPYNKPFCRLTPKDKKGLEFRKRARILERTLTTLTAEKEEEINKAILAEMFSFQGIQKV